jgi:DNA-binding CsgD family transcriptional regulator/PAS domain-containing protein
MSQEKPIAAGKPRVRNRADDPAERTARDLMSAIYNAVIDPRAWKVFLQSFMEAVQGDCASLVWSDLTRPGSGGSLSYWVGGDPGDAAASEYHECRCCIVRNQSVLGVISSLRPTEWGPFSEAATQLTQSLVPHLRQALEIHTRMVNLQDRLDATTDVLDRLPTGIIFVDGNGRVLQCNATAKVILGRNDGLSSSQNGLTAALSKEASLLKKLIRDASIVDNTMLISRPSGKRPLAVTITRQPNAGADPETRMGAVVFLKDPEPETEKQKENLGLNTLYGLTPAEAKLAQWLAQGKRLKEASAEFGVSHNTVRSQLQRIFEKTTTSHQSDLVRLLARIITS